jgi:magnesium-transporting ATPase (P-type)
MSVIVKDPEGKVYLYCKGADSAILDRVTKKSDSETMEQFLEVDIPLPLSPFPAPYYLLER